MREKNTEVISTRLSPSDRVKIESVAKQRNISVSDYTRAVLLDSIVNPSAIREWIESCPV